MFCDVGMQAVIGKWNDEATLEARGRYSAEVARLQKAHALHCDSIQAQHHLVCQQVSNSVSSRSANKEQLP